MQLVETELVSGGAATLPPVVARPRRRGRATVSLLLDLGETVTRGAIVACHGGRWECLAVVAAQPVLRRGGLPVSLSATVGAVRDLVDSAVRQAGIAPTQSFLALPSRDVTVRLHHSGRGVRGTIRERDVHEVLRLLLDGTVPRGLTRIDALVKEFRADDTSCLRDPVGIRADRIESTGLVLRVSQSLAMTLERLAREAGPVCRGLTPAVIAASAAVLSEEERMGVTGVALIGAGSTEIARVRDGVVCGLGVLDEGGATATRDLAEALRTIAPAAENLKRTHGCGVVGGATAGATVSYGDGAGHRRTIALQDLEATLSDSTEGLLVRIRETFEAGGAEPCTRFVFTGGGAALPGLLRIADNVFREPTRIGAPLIPGLQDAGPELATLIGLAFHRDSPVRAEALLSRTRLAARFRRMFDRFGL